MRFHLFFITVLAIILFSANEIQNSFLDIPVPEVSFAQAKEITLSWAPVNGAAEYQVMVYEQNDRIYEVVVNTNSTLVELKPGFYSWFVFPITDGQVAPIATVQSTLTVE